MAVTTTNLGVITAYGDAVAAGYTGTKAEWQTLMASYATVGQQAVDAKNAAVDAKNAAVQAKDTAVAAKDTATSKATEATTAANTATTKASEASASAQSIAQSASQIAQNTSDISELKEDLSINNDVVFQNENFVRGKYLNSNDVLTNDDDYCVSDYVAVTSGTTIQVIGGETPEQYRQTWVVEYNSNKTLVDYWGIPKTASGRSVTLTASSTFVRIGFVLGYGAKVTQGSTILWEPESDGVYGIKKDLAILSTTVNQNMADVQHNQLVTNDVIRLIDSTFHVGIATSSGTIDADGADYANATDMISADTDTLITAESGYTFFLQLFNSDGTHLRTVGWTDRYTVSVGQKYMVTVTFSPINSSYHAAIDEFKTAVKIGRVYKQWEGKKWYSFGTSISDTTFPMPYDLGGYTGKYPPYLAQLSGLIHTNYAIGGSRITMASTADRTTILNKIMETDLSDADLITIDLPVNDFGVTAIGDLESLTPDNADDSTFYGAMFLAITHCLENSNAVVCLLTDNTGKIWTTPQGQTHPMDLRPWKKDGNGKTQDDYCDAMRKISTYLGCYCIDAGSMASINYCHPEYIQDTIHQSDLGGKQYANAIWSILKDIQPNVPTT